MNYHKLKDVINMKFMGESEVRHQLLEMVEKQEPKKIAHTYYCPNCMSRMVEYNLMGDRNDYCGQCGQRVWYD